MQTGKIARLIRDKGFGFIKVEGQEKDLFFHSNSLAEGTVFDSLQDGDNGDTVTFEVADSPKGPNAINVSKVG